MSQWEVVGGVDKGGILVREGQDLKSTQCADRLTTGSVVAEIALAGERLHYKLVTGTGPDEGWVSLKISGKQLLVPLAVAADATTWTDRLKATLAAEPTAAGNLKEAAPILRSVGKAPARARVRLVLFNWTGNRGGAGSAHQFLQWPKMFAEKCQAI